MSGSSGGARGPGGACLQSDNVRDLATELGAGQRLLGLDVGSKTIGVALSDVGRTIASPHLTIRRAGISRDAAALGEIIEDQDVGGVVIGLPINMDGSDGSRCQSVRQFAANLQARVEISVAFWDERWSTVAVTRSLISADVSRRRRRRLVDKMAAAYILQGSLDFLAGDRIVF